MIPMPPATRLAAILALSMVLNPGWMPSAWAARPNIALNKVCKASSVEGMLTPDKAVDGPKTQGSRWGSNYGTDKNKDSAWFLVDLGRKYTVDSIAIYWEHSGAKRYSIQAWKPAVDTPSYDDSRWSTLFTDTTLQYQPRPVDMCLSFIKLDPVETRFLRVRCYKRLFEFGYSIMEFEAYGTEGPAVLQSHAALRPRTAAPKPGSRFRAGGDFSLTGRFLPDRFLP
ncbi:MAG: putative secreted protein [Fibrobacteres bacterium]|nr:putative secreted protein [Fibrobacterota bacterium]